MSRLQDVKLPVGQSRVCSVVYRPDEGRWVLGCHEAEAAVAFGFLRVEPSKLGAFDGSGY